MKKLNEHRINLHDDMEKKKSTRRLHSIKGLLLVAAVAALSLGVAGGSSAFLAAATAPEENKMSYASVSSEITEAFDGDVKSDVSVKNTGNTMAYIRVAVLVTWQDGEGRVYAEAPENNVDYIQTMSATGSWFQGEDGYYYHREAVSPGENSTDLMESLQAMQTQPEGYTLSVEILADAIQSAPDEAVEESWPVLVDTDGSLMALPEGGGL